MDWLGQRPRLARGPGTAAVQQPAGARTGAGAFAPGVRDPGGRAAAEQARGIEPHTLGRQRGQAVEHRHQARAAGAFDGHREVLTPLEDLPDQPAQHRARSHLEEHAGAVLVHRRDLAHELDGTDQVLPEQPRDLARIAGVRLTGGVRVHRHARLGDRGLLQHPRQLLLGGGDERRVKCACDRQHSRGELAFAAALDGRLDVLAGPGEHRLARRVEVCHDHSRALQQRRQLLRRRLDGGHRPGLGRGGLLHEAASRLGQLQQLHGIDRSGGGEGDELPVAVTGAQLWGDAERLEHSQPGELGGPQRGLGDVRVGELGLAAASLLGRQCRGREHIARQCSLVAARQHPVGELELLARLRKRDRQISAHVQQLRALAREQEREPALPRERTLGEVDAIALVDRRGPG